MRKNIVIDLEMCAVQMRTRNYRRKHEIVQIGAVMLNDDYKEISRFSTYVRPDYGKIDHFISSLTGIANRDVKNAPGLKEALFCMLDWIGDGDVKFYAWSDTDYNQVKNELLAKEIEEERFETLTDPENWVNYQRVVDVRFEIGRCLKLSDALMITEVEPEGRLHDGLDDAVNTARLVAKLELHPDYKCMLEKLREEEEKQEPLTTSLGSLLKGIVLETA